MILLNQKLQSDTGPDLVYPFVFFLSFVCVCLASLKCLNKFSVFSHGGVHIEI